MPDAGTWAQDAMQNDQGYEVNKAEPKSGEPQTLKHLHAFARKCNYHRWYIKDYAIVVSDGTSQKIHWKWSQTHTWYGPYIDIDVDQGYRSFWSTTEDPFFTSYPGLPILFISKILHNWLWLFWYILAYPYFSSPKPFIIDCDYSGNGIGNVHSPVQYGIEKPVVFTEKDMFSRQINLKNTIFEHFWQKHSILAVYSVFTPFLHQKGYFLNVRWLR